MSSPDSPQPARKKPGLRERGKEAKKRRIVAAARAVLVEHGYDAATTREIAERADVAVGTVFLYASDKRDLLFLVLNSELDEIVDEAFARSYQTEPLLAALLQVFRTFYEYFAINLKLGRYGLREMDYYTSRPLPDTEQARRYRERNERVPAMIADMVRRAQVRNEIDATADPAMVAEVLNAIYRTEVRRWLNSDNPRLDAGIERLRKLLMLAFRGLSVQPGRDAPGGKQPVAS